MCLQLILYRKYLANYNTANRTLKQLEGNKRFVDWLARTEEENADQLRGQRLPSLLIQPVQRIPRYRMLLDELLKQYAKFQQFDVEGQLAQVSGALDTGDMWLRKNQKQMRLDNAVSDLKEAASKIAEVAATVNESIREVEVWEELYEIQESLKGLAGRALMDHDRRLLKRGDIFKVTRKDPKKYHLLLFSDCILTTTEEKNGSYKLHQWIELQNPASSVVDITPEQIAAQAQALTAHALNPTNAFYLNSSAKSFEVVCEGNPTEAAEEKKEWLELLSEAIAECRGDAAGDDEWQQQVAAAVWTPNADGCEVCERQFSYKLRRHHCRACGCNVCKTCSAYKRERTITGSQGDLLSGGKTVEAKVLQERICANCAGVDTPTTTPRKADAEESAAAAEPVVATYKCIKKTAIKSGFDMDSEKAGTLAAGTIVEALEVRENDKGVQRVRFDRGFEKYELTTAGYEKYQLYRPGWISAQTAAGVVVLELVSETLSAEPARVDPSSVGGATAAAMSLELQPAPEGAPETPGTPRSSPRAGYSRKQVSLTRGATGLGLEIDDQARIQRYTMVNGPGELAGVEPGWIIAAVNGLKVCNKLEVVAVITSSPGGAALQFDFDIPAPDPEPAAPAPAAAAAGPPPSAAEAGPPPALPAFLGAVPNLPARLPGGRSSSEAAAPLPGGLPSGNPVVVASRPKQGGTLGGAPVDDAPEVAAGGTLGGVDVMDDVDGGDDSQDGFSDDSEEMDADAQAQLAFLDDFSSGSEEEDMGSTGYTPSPRVSEMPLPRSSDFGLTRLPPEDGGAAGSEAGLHTLAELQAGIPEGVDVSRKEDYLSDDEFLAAFGMSRGEFRDCKKWKQTSLKKKVGIY